MATEWGDDDARHAGRAKDAAEVGVIAIAAQDAQAGNVLRGHRHDEQRKPDADQGTEIQEGHGQRQCWQQMSVLRAVQRIQRDPDRGSRQRPEPTSGAQRAGARAR